MQKYQHRRPNRLFHQDTQIQTFACKIHLRIKSETLQSHILKKDVKSNLKIDGTKGQLCLR